MAVEPATVAGKPSNTHNTIEGRQGDTKQTVSHLGMGKLGHPAWSGVRRALVRIQLPRRARYWSRD